MTFCGVPGHSAGSNVHEDKISMVIMRALQRLLHNIYRDAFDVRWINIHIHPFRSLPDRISFAGDMAQYLCPPAIGLQRMLTYRVNFGKGDTHSSTHALSNGQKGLTPVVVDHRFYARAHGHVPEIIQGCNKNQYDLPECSTEKSVL